MIKGIMFSLVLMGLFVFAEGSPAVEASAPVNETGALPETVEAGQHDETIEAQGTEGTTITFYGQNAGRVNTGAYNSFFGSNAGYNNTIGTRNSFFGRSAGHGNETGTENSFFGAAAGYSNNTGINNSFFGYRAGYKNTTGNSNSFFGRSAGEKSITGVSNSFFGGSAGYSNTGDNNSFFGNAAGNMNTTGNANSFFGESAGNKNTTGDSNCFFGRHAGFNNQTGSGNVFLGYKAGYEETGSNRLYIANSETTSPLIYGEFDNKTIQINGNFRATATAVTSDRRLKRNIRPLKRPLDRVIELEGVVYEWNVDEYPDRGLGQGEQIGLIAQDVEKVMPQLVSEDGDGYKAVSYAKLTAVLVEAVKELKALAESQQKEIERLRALVETKGRL